MKGLQKLVDWIFSNESVLDKGGIHGKLRWAGRDVADALVDDLVENGLVDYDKNRGKFYPKGRDMLK